eukprot:g26677.t1
MPTASLIKFPVMVETYRRAEAGKLDLSRMLTLKDDDKVPGSGILTKHFSGGMKLSLRDAVRLMIAHSDNTATNLVLDEIGLKATGDTMKQLGFPNTRIHAKVFRRDTSIDPEASRKYGLGVTTAAEMVGLFEALYAGKLVKADAAKEIREHLYSCEDDNKLARFLPAGVKIAHKGGAVSAVRCAAGVIESKSGPIAICVMTARNRDRSWSENNRGNRLCAEIARRVFQHFNPASTGTIAKPGVLKQGDSGKLVEALQRTLNARLKPSPKLSIDGDFGPSTESALKKFQRARRIPETGIAAAPTWKALGALLTSDPPVPDPKVINSQRLPIFPRDTVGGTPFVTCQAWAIGSGKTGKLLWSTNGTEKRNFASTTKIMTAYIVLSLAQKSPGVLDETVVFSERADRTPGSTSGLRAGEKVTVRELLYGLMLPSGNDASVALAEHFGKRLKTATDKSDDPLELFVAEMNRVAKRLGMKNTHYENPHGLTARGHLSTAADLLRLAHAATRNHLFRNYIRTRQRGCTVVGPGGYRRNVRWKNTNRLLGIEGYLGVKTGTTSAAGACLVSMGRRGDDDLIVIARRGLRESAHAWPGEKTDYWWKWLVEAGNSVRQRIRILDGSLEQAFDLVREGARVAIAVDHPEISFLTLSVGRGRRFIVESPQWELPRKLTAHKLRRMLRKSIREPMRFVFCDPVDITAMVDDDHTRHATPWARLRGLLRPEWSDIWIVLIFAMFVGLLTLATPIAVEALVNTVAFGRLIQPVVVLALLLLAFLAFSAAMRALQTWVVEIIQRRLFARVAGDLAFRLPRIQRRGLDDEYGPELVNRFFDVVTVQKVSAQLLLDGVALLLGALIGMAVLAFYHPWLLAFDLFLLLMILLIIFGLGRGAVASSILESKYKYRMAAWLEELARCQITFKHDGAPEFAAERADRLTADYLATRKKHFRILFRQILFALGLQAVASTVLLGLGGWLVISGQLTLGQLVAAELIVTVIVGSFAKLGKHMESFYDLLAAVDKLGHLFDLPLEAQHGALSLDVKPGSRLSLRDVRSASITGGPWTFDADPGERIAITGLPGSGKTALLELMFGLREPDGGHVLLDDVDVRDLRPDVLRHHVALARAVEVFEGTIAENVSLERSEVSLADVREALRKVGLLDAVLGLPDGLETTLNANATSLSGTQARLLVLARAIVGRPRLLLIDALLDALSDDELDTLIPELCSSDNTFTLMVISGRKLIVDSCDRRVIDWDPKEIYEGARVKKGDVILQIRNIDPEYLNRLNDQRDALKRELEANRTVVTAYRSQVEAFETVKTELVAAADQYIKEAEQKIEERQQKLLAERASELQANADYKRQKSLFDDGLASELKMQTAERKWKEAQSKVKQAQAAVDGAMSVLKAKRNERSAKEREAQAKIESATAMYQKAQGDVAKLQKLVSEIDVKVSQQENQDVKAPRDGFILKMMVNQGGEIVKEGDPLFVLVPDTEDRAVEILLSGNDAPLVTPGDHVRLQFEGWPAVQFAGWPSVAVGTFGGRVVSVDATDNGRGNFRILVGPDPEDKEWPSQRFLRQGVRANGWVLLKEVTLGYELWRRINGFPPVVDVSASRMLFRHPELQSPITLLGLLCVCVVGCAAPTANRQPIGPFAREVPPLVIHKTPAGIERLDESDDETSASAVRLASFDEDAPEEVNANQKVPPAPAPDLPGTIGDASPRALQLDDVIGSIRESYPLLESAFLSRNVAAGEQLSASGFFDLKLKAASESGPLGFYQTYRHGIGVDQPLYGGGNVFAGYRVGRGDFQPWYLERQTNDGGEFKMGLQVPLMQNRDIDERRAALWRTTFGRQRVEPEIQAQLIEFIFFGSIAYWEWVAAGQRVEINAGLLKLATERQAGINNRIKKGDLARIAATDNQRLIVSRQAKLTDSRRKLRQSAVKLSLFVRNADGTPMIPSDALLPKSFPQSQAVDDNEMQSDVNRALANRPELQILDLLTRQLEVDLAQAGNLTRPALDAVVAGSQDVGKPTSKKRDKSPFELEAGLYLTVPVQRRKARGKIQSLEAKVAQIAVKRRFTRDKITTDVQTAYAALTASYRQIIQARQALELARTMEDAERRKFAAGASDLLVVNLRESQTASAAADLVDALLQYFQARAAYRASLALDVIGPDGE